MTTEHRIAGEAGEIIEVTHDRSGNVFLDLSEHPDACAAAVITPTTARQLAAALIAEAETLEREQTGECT